MEVGKDCGRFREVGGAEDGKDAGRDVGRIVNDAAMLKEYAEGSWSWRCWVRRRKMYNVMQDDM